MAANNDRDSRARLSSSGRHCSRFARPILERMPPQLKAWFAVIFPESTSLMASTSKRTLHQSGGKDGRVNSGDDLSLQHGKCNGVGAGIAYNEALAFVPKNAVGQAHLLRAHAVGEDLQPGIDIAGAMNAGQKDGRPA